MANSLKPMGELKIMKATRNASGSKVRRDITQAFSEAYLFKLPDAHDPTGNEFSCRIEQSINDDSGGASVFSGTLHNVNKDIIGDIDGEGWIQVRAGYLGGPILPTTVYYGQLNYAIPHRQGGEVNWTISATTNPAALLSSHIPLEAESATAEELILQLLGKVGATPRHIDPVMRGEGPGVNVNDVTFTNYTATGPVGEELNFIMETVRERTGHLISTVPNATEALSFDIIDFTLREEALEYHIDLGSPFVQSASPVAAKDTLPGALVQQIQDEEGGIITVESFIKVSAFNLTVSFDPRITLGTIVVFSDELYGNGAFLVEAVTHEIGSGTWVTSCEGQLYGGDTLFATG